MRLAFLASYWDVSADGFLPDVFRMFRRIREELFGIFVRFLRPLVLKTSLLAEIPARL